MAATVTSPRKKATKTLTRTAYSQEIARRAKPKAKRGKAQSWVFSMLLTEHIEAILAGKTVTATSASSGKTHVFGFNG
jgi:hypothetical protein